MHRIAGDSTDCLESESGSWAFKPRTSARVKNAGSRSTYDGRAVLFVSPHWPNLERALEIWAKHNGDERLPSSWCCDEAGALSRNSFSRRICWRDSGKLGLVLAGLGDESI